MLRSAGQWLPLWPKAGFSSSTAKHTDGHVAALVPSLAVPLVAGAAGEVGDSSSLWFLTVAILRQRKKEEEMVKERVKRQQAQVLEEALRVQERTRELLRRKRKKKRKKRLHRTTSLPSRKLWRRLRLRVRVCRLLERLLLWCHEFGGVWVLWFRSTYALCVGYWLRQHSANPVLYRALLVCLVFGVWVSPVAYWIIGCLRTPRSAWSDGGYTHLRQFIGHLEDFCGISTAPCTWRCSCLRSTGTPFSWEMTSGNAVFSASWFDSGYVIVSLRWPGYCFRAQRNAWSSVVHALRQSRSLRISTFYVEIDLSAVAAHLPGRQHPCFDTETG